MSAKELKEMYDAMDAFQVVLRDDRMMAFKDLFAYQGFDPQVTFDELKKCAAAAGKKRDDFMEDMTALLVFFASRGSKYVGKKKAKGKTKTEGKAKMDALYATYKITDDYPNNAEDITLPRISSVFPHLTARLFSSNVGRRVTKSPYFEALQFPAAASLIPATAEWNGFFEKWLLWAIEYDSTVNPEKANAENVKNYAGIARRSQYTSEQFRKKIMKDLGYVPSQMPTIIKDSDNNAKP